MTVDSLEIASRTPEPPQPYAELGLKDDEYQRIRDILGRRPTACELAMYSVMWSEHCSYKSSKVHLRRFGELPAETATGKLLAGIGENAGVVDIGQGYAVTFKAESHNHPSYVEPYQGAATGVGGIVRDILAMGARPVAVMDSLRFGPADAPDTRRVLPGVVSGVGGYGNSLGLPNVGGEVAFDRTYAGNPLVNALCLGVLRHEDLHLAAAAGTGNQVILYGAKTGGDGIGGVSVLASAEFGDESSGDGSGENGGSKRPAVQVGDPFMEKLLIEATLELFHAGVVSGIQDLGGAGLSCATSELASAGDGGMRIHLDRVPLRDPGLAPEEILMSESQERMMAVVEPRHVDEFLRICAKWDVPATVIGEVTDSERLVVDWHGETVVDVPPRTVAHEGPVYDLPYARPGWIDDLQRETPDHLPRPTTGDELADTVLRLAGSAELADRSWVTDQYDRFVLGNTVAAQPDDGGMIRIDEQTGLGVALALDCNGRFAQLDPYEGARLAVAEAYRNVATVGARPLAVTDCLNFGSPDDPGVMWQFSEAVRGIADACAELGLPVTGGNVSLYNQTGGTAILPTPVVGVLGVTEDVERRIPSGWGERDAGAEIYLLGESRAELAGSAWAHVVHGHLGGLPPRADLDAERALADVLLTTGTAGMLRAAHDLSEGGLAQALVEACLRYGTGATVALPDTADRPVTSDRSDRAAMSDRSEDQSEESDPCAALFGESAGRAIAAVAGEDRERFLAACADRGVPATRIGTVGGDALTVEGHFALDLADLRAAWSSTLPALFD